MMNLNVVAAMLIDRKSEGAFYRFQHVMNDNSCHFLWSPSSAKSANWLVGARQQVVEQYVLRGTFSFGLDEILIHGSMGKGVGRLLVRTRSKVILHKSRIKFRTKVKFSLNPNEAVTFGDNCYVNWSTYGFRR